MTLLGPNGQPIEYRKERPKATGPSFGLWGADRSDLMYATLPGGGVMQFDLSTLTLADYRAMRYNPQINASLSVLTFMLHQVDWHIECKDAKIAATIDEILRPMWTRLVRGLSQAFWAGFSPIAIEYENDVANRRVVVDKFKDLLPEDSSVSWNEVEGSYRPPGAGPGFIPQKFKIYDGIDQFGVNYTIPPENTLWYPLLMENGDYTGRKLLKAAFVPWFFSTIIHLFANRYYERFGEPLPIGRAPFDDTLELQDGTELAAKDAMTNILMNFRNRSTVVLPSERQQAGGAGASEYTWDIDYLESQMRGADFERYMTRLDEEMSIALFTPLLLLRNADVGSHNLGVQHTQTWLWCLNAIAGDMKEYIDRYVIKRLKRMNFSETAPDAEWMPHKMGKENADTLRSVVAALIQKDKISVDIDELGQALGMTVKEVREVTRDEPDEDGDDDSPPDTRVRVRDGEDGPRGVGEPRATGREISNRIRSQVGNAWRENRFGDGLSLSFGYRKRFVQSLRMEGYSADEANALTDQFYETIESTIAEIVALGKTEFQGPNEVMALIDRVLDNEIERLRS